MLHIKSAIFSPITGELARFEISVRQYCRLQGAAAGGRFPMKLCDNSSFDGELIWSMIEHKKQSSSN